MYNYHIGEEKKKFFFQKKKEFISSVLSVCTIYMNDMIRYTYIYIIYKKMRDLLIYIYNPLRFLYYGITI